MTANKSKRSRLSRPNEISSSSNCFKLEEQAIEFEGEEMSGEEWMRLTDVAAESNLALSTIYFLIKTDRGPKFSRLGRNIRVKRSDFNEWFEANREN